VRLCRRIWRHKRHKFYRKWKDWLEAFRQVSVVLLISNIVPLFVIFLIHVVSEAKAPFTISEFYFVAATNIKPSDAFIYICALIAPVLYTMYSWNKAGKYFPYFWWFIGSQGLIELVGVIIFGMDRLNKINNWDFVRGAAIFLYVLALLVWYFSIVFDNRRLSQINSIPSPSGAQGILESLKRRGE